MANLLRMFPGLTILDLLSYVGKREFFVVLPVPFLPRPHCSNPQLGNVN